MACEVAERGTTFEIMKLTYFSRMLYFYTP